MQINIREAGRVAILDLDGPLRLGPAEDAFRKYVQQLIEAGSIFVAVNLTQVTDLDSSGVGALVRAFSHFKRAGGKCLFFSPNERVQLVLRMVRLDRIFEISENEAAALGRF